MGTIRLLLPRATTSAPVKDVGLLRDLRESRAGIFPNGKPNAAPFMERLVDLLGERYGVIEAINRQRSIGPRPSAEVYEELASRCDWSFGHESAVLRRIDYKDGRPVRSVFDGPIRTSGAT